MNKAYICLILSFFSFSYFCEANNENINKSNAISYELCSNKKEKKKEYDWTVSIFGDIFKFENPVHLKVIMQEPKMNGISMMLDNSNDTHKRSIYLSSHLKNNNVNNDDIVENILDVIEKRDLKFADKSIWPILFNKENYVVYKDSRFNGIIYIESEKESKIFGAIPSHQDGYYQMIIEPPIACAFQRKRDATL